MSNDNTNNVLGIDVLTSLNLLTYVSYSLFFPLKTNSMLLIEKAVLDGFDTHNEISQKIGAEGKNIFSTLSKMQSIGIITRDENKKIILTDKKESIKKIKEYKDTIIKNSKIYTNKDLTSLYNSFAELSYMFFDTKTKKNFSDLVFDYQSAIELLSRRLIKNKSNLTKYLILYYLSMFSGLDHIRLHRLIPSKTVKNIKVVMRSMEIQGLIFTDKNDVSERKQIMYVSDEGLSELKDIINYANSEINKLEISSPTKISQILKTINTICECSTRQIKRNIMKDRDLFAKESSSLYL